MSYFFILEFLAYFYFSTHKQWRNKVKWKLSPFGTCYTVTVRLPGLLAYCSFGHFEHNEHSQNVQLTEHFGNVFWTMNFVGRNMYVMQACLLPVAHLHANTPFISPEPAFPFEQGPSHRCLVILLWLKSLSRCTVYNFTENLWLWHHDWLS